MVSASGVKAANAVQQHKDINPAELFKVASRSIVRIFAEVDKKNLSTGSGVIVSQGIIATNCHVISNQKTVLISHDKQVHLGRTIYESKTKDLCLVEVKKFNAPHTIIKSTKQLSPGMRAYAIGAPQGLDLTISEGLISGLREIGGMKYIQTSTAISHGSSGGGLFLSDGNLVGITTFTIKDGQNINFAIPSDWISEALLTVGETPAENNQKRDYTQSITETNEAENRQWAASIAKFFHVNGGCNLTSEDFLTNELIEIIRSESAKFKIDKYITIALISKLSECRKYLVDENGARGYFRIDPKFAKRIGINQASDLFGMRVNIRVGCVYLKHLIDNNQGINIAISEFFKMSYSSNNSRMADQFANDVILLSKKIAAYVQAEQNV